MSKYDTIIVGAGPAGSSAAYLLAKAGMRVLLIDKSAFPRHKLCGGLLSGRSEKIFYQVFHQANLKPGLDYTTKGMRLYYQQRFLNDLQDERIFHLTTRELFDTYLAELAAQQGLTFLQRAPVREVDAASNTVILQNGRSYQADFIIGADGVLSRVAQRLNPTAIKTQRFMLGLEAELPRKHLQEDVTTPEIYFGLVKWGYGWVFPKSETITVGLGGVWRKNPHIKPQFQSFLKQRFHVGSNLPIRGHFLPYHRYRHASGQHSILLVGDAAGLVEPITGEGISFAMQSGQFAAQAILEAAGKGSPSTTYAIYRKKYRHFIRMFDTAHLMSYFLFPPKMEAAFAKVMTKSRAPLIKQMDLLADEIGYKEFVQFLLTKSGKYAVKKCFRQTGAEKKD
ncbi:geranylgeranyl reductase [candidate division KSB3 bacterium]|uniref:Geranylgeranyl reductase n=1 Tax=candidate division KSB3 bacterium TaxID=2044937 RepID=A0A2G6K903_9BACT|nr:MAG: geranylgeranyl reductase [candidate division KSB3 bacterium]